MVQFFDEIPDSLYPWIKKQKMFWVASAPLSGDGLVNISPKGGDNIFHIVNPRQVWYEDLSGSGIATIAHLRENGRITLLFHAFEGHPRTLRIYGRGVGYEFGTPEYEAFLPPEKRQISSRSVILIDVIKINTSCGWGVPIYEFKAQRHRMRRWYSKREVADIEAESNLDKDAPPPRPVPGLRAFWVKRNLVTVDGLPGLLVGPNSRNEFKRTKEECIWPVDDEREFAEWGLLERRPEIPIVAGVAFLTGALISASYFRFLRSTS